MIILRIACLVVATASISMAQDEPSLANLRDSRASIQTLAGDGVAGTENGPGGSARFLLPGGVAVDRKSGIIYVADYAANQIRTIDRSGNVRLFAGVSSLRAGRQSSTGGYRDGNRAMATFNRPLGLAVANDGSLYVADSGNHCVRRIAGNLVSTVIGGPDRAGYVDGSVTDTRLQEPRFLAFDAAGGLYVSDYSNGLRYFRDGVTTTIKALADDRFYGKRANGLSYFKGKTEVLYIASITGVLRYDIQTKQTAEISYPFMVPGNISAFDVAALSDTVAVASSPRWSTLEFLKFPDGVGTASPLAFPITGPSYQNSADDGGFRDGAPREARFSSPLGIAIDGEGDIIVADSANRRIRRVPPLDTRWGPDTVVPVTHDPRYYTIAIAGNSFAYWDTTFSRSIQGIVEAKLNAQRALLQIPKPVRVIPMRLDGTNYSSEADYLTTVSEAGGIDTLIWLLNPDTFKLDTLNLPEHFDPVATNAADTLDKTSHALASNGTRLFIAPMPTAMDASPTEDLYQKFNLEEGTFSGGNLEPGLVLDQQIDKFFSARSQAVCSVTKAFAARERLGHVSLFAPEDQHFSPAGNSAVADVLVGCLISLKPWLKH